MQKRVLKIIFPICTIFVSLLWIGLGISKYGLWDKLKGPMPGFFPSLIALVLLGSSISALAITIKTGKTPTFLKSELLTIGAILLLLASVFVLGMLPALAIFTILWLKVLEKYPWKIVLIVFLILACLVYGVFVMWLQVNFPQGMIGLLFK